jgi:hypothetical protein
MADVSDPALRELIASVRDDHTDVNWSVSSPFVLF